MLSWCVVHTQPFKEFIAKQHLLDQGYDVYLPKFRKTCRHARQVEEKLVPLFPRYMFVGMDLNFARWRSINSTRGVSYLLMTDALNPAKVPSRVIDKMRAQAADDEIVTISSLKVFTEGAKVRILDGVFKDQIAIFESFDDKARVQVLLTFMGRQMQMILPTFAVEAA